MSSIYSNGGASGGTPPQLCQRCGSPLPFNEVYCGNCGFINAAATTNNPTERASSPNVSWGNPAPPAQSQPQTAYGQNQYTGNSWGAPSNQSAPPPPGNPYNNGASVPQLSFPAAPAQPSSPSYPNNFYGTPAPQSNPSNFYGAPTQGSSPNYYGAPAPAQQGFNAAPPAMPGGLQSGGMNNYPGAGFNPQPPVQKRKSNIGLIVGIVILLLVLIVGGIGGYVYVKGHSGASTQLATPTPVPTATPGVAPLFSDTFQNNNNGWDLTSETGKFSAKVGGGTLVLEDDENRLLPELIPGGKTFDNFSISFDAVLSKGTKDNGYGVYIRGASNQNSDLATYYRFELYGDGTFAIFKGTVDASGNSTSNPLVNYTTSSAVQKVGAVNHVTVSANGSSMTFTVNGQKLATTSDPSYTGGSIALFVSNIEGAPPIAQATFSKLYVYPA